MQITTHHQLYLLRNGEIRKRQILLPALLQSQPDALLSTTSTPPPLTCHTWYSLHSLNSSTIFQPPSHHTSGQKPHSNDNWWILKWVFQPFFLLSNHIRNCRPPRTEGALQGLCRVREEQHWLVSIWTTILKLRPSMLFGDLHSLAKFLQFLWIQSWLLEQQPPLQQLQMKLNPGDSYPAKCEQQ